jgi:hypothetical protein
MATTLTVAPPSGNAFSTHVDALRTLNPLTQAPALHQHLYDVISLLQQQQQQEQYSKQHPQQQQQQQQHYQLDISVVLALVERGVPMGCTHTLSTLCHTLGTSVSLTVAQRCLLIAHPQTSTTLSRTQNKKSDDRVRAGALCVLGHLYGALGVCASVMLEEHTSTLCKMAKSSKTQRVYALQALGVLLRATKTTPAPSSSSSSTSATSTSATSSSITANKVYESVWKVMRSLATEKDQSIRTQVCWLFSVVFRFVFVIVDCFCSRCACV